MSRHVHLQESDPESADRPVAPRARRYEEPGCIDSVDLADRRDHKTPRNRLAERPAPRRSPPFFQGMAAAVIEEFGSFMTKRPVQRGTTIFAKGDPGTGLMAVVAGAV